MNKILLVGRATKKPLVAISKNGLAYTNITLAIDDRGNEKQPVDFIDIKAFGKVADILNKFVDKGQLLFIEAKAKQNVYEAEDGTKKYTIDFVLQEFEFLSGSNNKAEEEKKEEATEETKEETNKEDLPF